MLRNVLSMFTIGLMHAVSFGSAADRRRAKEALRGIPGALGHKGSGGGIRRALNLRNLAAWNEYRPAEAVRMGTLDAADAAHTRINRNAAKARRRRLRAAGRHP